MVKIKSTSIERRCRPQRAIERRCRPQRAIERRCRPQRVKPSCLPLLLCCLCFPVAFVAAEAVALLVLVALAGLSPCCSCAAPSAFWLFAASGKGDSGNKRHVNNKDPPTTKLEKTNVCCSETAKFSGAHRTWAQGRKQTNSSRAAPLFLG